MTANPLPSMDGMLMPRLGIEFVEATAERVEATMPVEGNTQPFGVLHGGATAALCETVASVGGYLIAGEGRIALGVEINVNHLRSVTEGSVTAVAIPLHVGRTTTVWDVRVTDDLQRQVAVSRVTLALRDARR